MATKKKVVNITKDDKSTEKFGKDKHGKIIKLEDKGEPRKRATSKRVIACLLWALGIFFEVIAILRVTDVINWIPKLSDLTFVIICLVLDCIAVVIGSQFWKKANHIDPASEKNKTKFWIQNNLGSIISVIAFLPIIIFVLTDKDMGKKEKGIISIVAVALMLLAGIASYDFNPVSSEQLERAQKEVEAVSESGLVYWAPNSKKYHVDKDCPAFSRSETVYEGTVAQAFEHNLTDPCRRCIPALEDDHDHENEEE